MFVLFFAIIWQHRSFNFFSEIFENHVFFFFSFSPRTVCKLSLWELAEQQTNKLAKNVHDISSHSFLTLSALVEEPLKFDSAVGR